MTRPIIYLICGSTGAGKTTYAIDLSNEARAVRFSIDEWMAALFWMDTPKPLDPVWAIERVERCYNHIWATAIQVAKRGISCVLDFGFVQRGDRTRFAELAQKEGFCVELHFLDVPANERWRRVEARNAQRSKTYQLPFDVTREMFDFVEGLWDPPDEAELTTLNAIVVPGSPDR